MFISLFINPYHVQKKGNAQNMISPIYSVEILVSPFPLSPPGIWMGAETPLAQQDLIETGGLKSSDKHNGQGEQRENDKGVVGLVNTLLGEEEED
jgi:hypothetical protein